MVFFRYIDDEYEKRNTRENILLWRIRH
jgi:hypothetical protein